MCLEFYITILIILLVDIFGTAAVVIFKDKHNID